MILKGSEITEALFNTIKNAKDELDELLMFNIVKGKRFDAVNAYIKILYSVNRPGKGYYQSNRRVGSFRDDHYQLIIGIGSYGDNDFLARLEKIQEVITLLRILLMTSEDMIIQSENESVDLRSKLFVGDCYPSYKSDGDVINEGIMNLEFKLNEQLFMEQPEIKKMGKVEGDVIAWSKEQMKKK